jgi:3-hydroxybutyrate dehydrogenase
VHGLVASPFKAAYVAAKHGVLGLVKVLALEGADAGISVAALCPAYVRTAIVEAQLRERSPDDLLAPQAVKRFLEPAEVAAAAAWLLGPEGRAVTGAPLIMDLGWTSH